MNANIVRQMQRHLANLEFRSNSPRFALPGPADKTAGYCIAEIPDWQLRQWIHALDGSPAQADRNPKGQDPEEGLGAEHESAVAEPCAQSPEKSA